MFPLDSHSTSPPSTDSRSASGTVQATGSGSATGSERVPVFTASYWKLVLLVVLCDNLEPQKVKFIN